MLIVDTLTWTLLWPMLKKNPDPERLAFFAHQLFNFTSYNQVRLVASMPALVLHRQLHIFAMLHAQAQCMKFKV